MFCQFEVTICDLQCYKNGVRPNPYVFTELGVAMLSSVLYSKSFNSISDGNFGM